MPGIFSFIWFFTIGLSTLRLHPKQVEWNFETWICLILTHFIFLVGYYMYPKLKEQVNKIIGKQVKNISSKKEIKNISEKNFFFFLCVMSIIPIISFIIEVILNNGMIPVFSKNMSAYQNFGRGIIHYFTVSSCLVFPIMYMYVHTYKIDFKRKIICTFLVLLNLLIPIMIVSRQLIIVSIVMLTFEICVFNKKNENKILIISLILILVGWSFIRLFRNQDSKYLEKALEMGDNYKLSTKNMQIYMYVSMNYDNFNKNVDNGVKYKYGTQSIYPIFGLIRLKQFLPQNWFEINLKRIINVYNTYPVVMTPYVDGGVIAVIIYMFIIGCICSSFESKNHNNVFYNLTYVILKVCLTFSFFANWFSRQTWWFYVIILCIMTKLFFNKKEIKEIYCGEKDEESTSIDVNI